MTARLHNEIDALAAAFYTECGKGRLSFQRCDACGEWRHLPRHRCAACGSASWTWTPSSGLGHIVTWSVTHSPVYPGFPEPLPYAVVIVELEEGVRMVSGVRGIAPDALAVDLPVRVCFETVDESRAVPFFRLR